MEHQGLGIHLDSDAPVETVRYLGSKSKNDLHAIGVYTVGDLQQKGVIDAYLEMKAQGRRINLNFLWAMFAGMMDIEFHKLPQEFKEAVKSELESATQKTTI